MSKVMSPVFMHRCVKNINNGLRVSKGWLTMIFMGILGAFLFIFEFPIMKMFLEKIKKPVILFVVGIFVTALPLYLVVTLSFLPFKYIMPIYLVSFMYMFLV